MPALKTLNPQTSWHLHPASHSGHQPSTLNPQPAAPLTLDRPAVTLKETTAAEQKRATMESPVNASAQPQLPGVPPRASMRRRRRGFIAAVLKILVGSPLAVGFSTLTLSNLLWLLGSLRFLMSNVRLEPPSRFRAGFPDDLAPGEVDTRYTAQHGVWIVRYEYGGQRQIYALRAACTHLGCAPLWFEAEQKFKCPCHGSGFYRDGMNFEGPAPRPLERFAIRLAEDGQIEVDQSRTFRQELGQWRDPASFLPA